MDRNIIKKASSVQSHQVNKLTSAQQFTSPRFEEGKSDNLKDDILYQQKNSFQNHQPLLTDSLQIPNPIKKQSGPGGVAGLQNMKKSLLVQNNITAGYN